MAGLDPVTGFTKRTQEDLVKQVGDDQVAELSPILDVSSSSPMGQLNGVVMKVAAELWDQLQAVYVAGDPDRNTGDGQDAVCAITGTTREPATHSQVPVTLALGAAVPVPAGSLMSVAGDPSVQFELVGPEPAPGFPVVPGDVVSVGAGSYDARFQSVNTGPVVANAGTLTVIVTPISGWTAGVNALDASLGHDVETPTALRIRREQELAAPGSTPVDALRAELYRLLAAYDIVGFVNVIENVGDTVDADGRPGHSIEALIDDGPSPLANDLIAQTLWDGRAGGIQTFGSSAGNALDDIGVVRPQNFNRPSLLPVWLVTSVVTNSAIFPIDGVAQIQAAMVAHGKTLAPGDDVARASFFGAVFSVVGVVNVTVLHLGFAPSPAGDADLAIGVRERATFDTSRISVTLV
jgi:hypothetical protein